MARPDGGDTYRPHFDIDPDADAATADMLREFEAVIYDGPDDALRAITTVEATPDAELSPLQRAAAFVISKDAAANFGFDAKSEGELKKTAEIQKLAEDRTKNARNPVLSEKYAAELRKARMVLFIGRAANHLEAQSASVLQMPRPRAQRKSTPTNRTA